MNTRNKLIASCLFAAIWFSSIFAQVSIDVNFNVKHIMGDVDSLDRQKFVNFHGTVNQSNWRTNNKTDNLIEDFLGKRDVHVGRNTGTISWNLKNSVTQDPSRPGFASPSSIASFGKSTRDSYAEKTWAHPYEYLDDEILCTQLSPFYPEGKTTNKGWAFSQTDTEEEPFGTASGEFLGRYIQEFYGTGGTTGHKKPNFVEITNEPLWDLVTVAEEPHDLTEIFKFHSTVAKQVHKYNPGVKVGGYCAAFPDFDKDNFQRWHDRDKHFIDVAGKDVDFWTIHLYDFPTHNGKAKYRKGSNVEATMDMLEQYSYLTLGEVKQLMISEYNAQTHDYNNEGWSGYRDWLKMKSTLSMMMQFMERADKINYAIPFFMLKAEWQYNSDVGVTSVHGARMLRRENEPLSYTGDFVYTDVIKIYDLLMGVKGKRVDSHSDNPDIMVDSYVDGNKAYVLINNLDFTSHNLNLFLGDFANNATNIEVRHLHLNGTDDNASSVLDINNGTSLPTDLTIGPEATYVIVFTYADPIAINEQLEETKYYANTYLQEIATDDTIRFVIDSVNLTDHGEAVLRLGVGRDHGLSLQPFIMVNDSIITVPDNFRGDVQTDRNNFFGVVEIPVPYAALKDSNNIKIVFPDAGGYVSTVTMQVFNFSKEIKRSVDTDKDGVQDIDDLCPDTPLNSTVDANGCRIDNDEDGVLNVNDSCPNTIPGALVDEKGCSIDDDGDGVLNDLDMCPGTQVGVEVDAKGCDVNGYYVSLYAKDSETGTAIDEGEIYIDGDTLALNSLGKTTSSFFAGEYPVTVNHPYYMGVDTVKIYSTEDVNILIAKTGVDLRVNVEKDGTRFSDASVTMDNKTQITNRLGYTIFYALKIDSTYDYTIHENDVLLQEKSLTVPESGVATIVVELTGLNDNRISKSGLTLFPNPVKDELHIKGLDRAVEYRISNMLGATVKEGQTQINKVNVTDIKNGIYFITIENEIYKFIKD